MREEAGRYQVEFADKIQSVVVGEGNTIYNYFYYSHEPQPVVLDMDDGLELPCPYRGLFHFGPNDADFFFGRDIFVAELYNATQIRQFIPVLGASGSGKSSVVLAGLVPKLQQEKHWQFTHFRPGDSPEADPFHALALSLVPLYDANLDKIDRMKQARKLAGCLRKGDIRLGDVFAQIRQNFPQDRILLIADQFEELYTLCPEAETRHRFLDQLIAEFQLSTDKPGRAVLVLTMRADFLGNALSYPAFADQLHSVDIKIRSMNREELAEVIEKPAAKLGVTFEGGLVERILNDVADQPGNLPLLEFALTELWQQRTGKQLTHEVYEAIGQVEGALARHADQKYEHLSETEKAQVRRIFVQLVRPGEGAEDTRRIAAKSELGEQSWSLVKQLADARLVVTSRNAAEQETVEVVHEALIRNWGELRGWMETDRVFRAWQERLRAAKQQWEMTNRDVGSLLRGAALAEAEEKLTERPDDLVAEREFIQQSIQERQRLKQEKAALRRREVRTARGIAIGSLVAVTISTGLLLTAWHQQKQARLSQADSLARYSLALLAEGKDLDASIVAIRAGKILQRRQTHDPEVITALRASIYEGRERNRLEEHDAQVRNVSFSPDSQTLASGSDDKTIKLWNAETGKVTRTLSGHSDWVMSVDFSPDGQMLASGSDDKTIKLWNIKTGEVVHTFSDHKSWIRSVRFSPDGQMLASGSDDKTIKLWNVRTGEKIHTLSGHKGSVESVSFSPDGQMLASGSKDQSIRLWDIETGKEIRTLFAHSDWVYSVSFSPDGQTIASGSKDQSIRLWDVETGKYIHTLSGHEDRVWSVSFSPDSRTLASGSRDQTIKLWNVETGEKIRTLSGHDDWVWSVGFSPNGQTIASGSRDQSIRLWDVETEGPTLFNHSHAVKSVSFSPAGQTLATGGDDETIKLWDVKTGKEIHTLSGHESSIASITFSPNGQILATGSADKNIKLWDVKTGKEIRSLYGHDGWVWSVSFSPDGQTLASGSADKTIKFWDVKTGKEIRSFAGHEGVVRSISFSPNGQTLASGSDDRTIKLWSIKTGEINHTLLAHDNYISSVSFSPDGQTLASGSEDRTITLWDVETGEQIYTFLGHKDRIWSVSFNLSGQILATGSADKTIKLWDTKTGEEVLTLFGHSGWIWDVSFSPDGQTLATASEDKTVKLWKVDLNSSSLIEHNCDRIHNYLKYNPNVREEDRHLCDDIN